VNLLHVGSRREYASRKQADVRLLLLNVESRQGLDSLDVSHMDLRDAITWGMPDEEMFGQPH